MMKSCYSSTWVTPAWTKDRVAKISFGMQAENVVHEMEEQIESLRASTLQCGEQQLSCSYAPSATSNHHWSSAASLGCVASALHLAM